MIRLRLTADKTSIPFLRARYPAYVVSLVSALASVVLFFAWGLNYGIDFEGGIMIEVGTEAPADIGTMRAALSGQGFGEVGIQEFGSPTEVLVRLERQEGDESEQQEVVDRVQTLLSDAVGEVSYRRIEFVGPKVSGELVEAGTMAVILAVGAMLVYIWFRFEWQFSVGAVVALVHDVVLTIGLFSLIGLEFNLSIIAAILAIVGYSMNDTVVVYDRVRENMRKFKQMQLIDLLNLSINDTLSRTVMTSVTTLIALLSLYFLGGEVIRGFTFAMIWGILVGTYSSIFIAGPALLFLHADLGTSAAREQAQAGE